MINNDLSKTKSSGSDGIKFEMNNKTVSIPRHCKIQYFI